MAWKLDIDPEKLARGESASSLFDQERRAVNNLKRRDKKIARESRRAVRELKKRGQYGDALKITERLQYSGNPYASNLTNADDIAGHYNSQRVSGLNRMLQNEGSGLQVDPNQRVYAGEEFGVLDPRLLRDPSVKQNTNSTAPSSGLSAPGVSQGATAQTPGFNIMDYLPGAGVAGGFGNLSNPQTNMGPVSHTGATGGAIYENPFGTSEQGSGILAGGFQPSRSISVLDNAMQNGTMGQLMSPQQNTPAQQRQQATVNPNATAGAGRGRPISRVRDTGNTYRLY